MSILRENSMGYFESVQLSPQEDQEDLSAFDQRAGKATISYEELLEELKSHGKL